MEKAKIGFSVEEEKIAFFTGVLSDYESMIELDFSKLPSTKVDYEHDLFAWIGNVGFLCMDRNEMTSLNDNILNDLAITLASLNKIADVLGSVYPALGFEADEYIQDLKKLVAKRINSSKRDRLSIGLKNVDKLVLIMSIIVLGCGVVPYANSVNTGLKGEKILESDPGEGVSRVSPLKEYFKTVISDQQQRIVDFTQFAIENGSPDYSGQGLSSCVVNSDCLSGVQECRAGVIPNSPDPGYCVQK